MTSTTNQPATDLNITVHHGNCLDILPTLPDCSIDSIVTDPPYELGFMGKQWDASGIAYNVTLWAECLRVLKPGGHLLAFGGTRTYHRMACAIEDAGFEIRDSIHWVYGSGFPKSLDVSKAIDKAAGAEREVVGTMDVGPDMRGGNYERAAGRMVADITAPATDDARRWQGWGTALKPAHEPIVLARKPAIGTVANNVLTHGTGALNIDGCRVGNEGGGTRCDNRDDAGKCLGHDNAGRSTSGQTVHGAERSGGRWPANVILSHSEGCRPVGTASDTMRAGERTANFGTQETQAGGNGSGNWGERTTSVAVWDCAPDCPTVLFPHTASTGNGSRTGNRNGGGTGPSVGLAGTKYAADGYSDGGSASRFFAQPSWGDDDVASFVYVAKPARKERNAGLDDLPEQAQKFGNQKNGQDIGNGSVNDRFTTSPRQNHHPTVKPLALMRYLVRLVTPPGGTVLEPFAGSGTTLMAAILEGVNAIGVEMTEEYLPIIEGRVAWAREQRGVEREATAASASAADQQASLFDE